MNRFGSVESSRRIVTMAPRRQDRKLVCPSYGNVLGTVVHGLFLSDFPSVRLRFDSAHPNDAHRARFIAACSYLARSGFQVTRRFETPESKWVAGGLFRVEATVRRLRTEAATQSQPLEIRVFDDLVPQAVRLFVSGAFYRTFALTVTMQNPARTDSLPLFESLCRSLGYRVREAGWDGTSISISISRDSISRPAWPLDEFLQANQWRTMVIFLNRLFPGGCEVCHPPSPPRSHPRPYRVEWCPIYREDGTYGQLVAFEGFNDQEWEAERDFLGGSPITTAKGSPIVVPSHAWGHGNWVKVVEPGRRDLHAFTRIPRPPAAKGQRIRTTRGTSIRPTSVSLTPLGGGQEIGANSYLLKVGTRSILLDCGFDVGNDPYNPLGLPHLEAIDKLDAVVLSHAHTDHVGSILMLHSLFPTVPIYCTPETGALTRVTIAHHASSDFRQMQEESLGVPLPPIREWGESFERVLKEVPFNETVRLGRLTGITLRFLPAGHILGAAFTELVVGNTRLLYTGDFCSRDQLTINGAVAPDIQKVDAVITEATNAGQDRHISASNDEVIDHLGSIVRPIVDRGGIALLPIFALGKAQEVYALVAEARRRHFSNLPQDRIWVVGLANRFFPVYSTYRENSKAVLPAEPPEPPDVDLDPGGNPTVELKRGGPGVVLATSGMLLPQTYSHSLARDLLKDPASALVLTGYQAPNTLGGRIKNLFDGVGPSGSTGILEHRSLPGSQVQVRAILGELGISGHATYDEIVKLMKRLDPERVIAVHGEENATSKLLNGLAGELPESALQAPANLETVDLGGAAISDEVVDSWKGLPVHLPQAPPLRIKSPRPSATGRRFRGWELEADTDRVRVGRAFPKPEGCSDASEVKLDPGAVKALVSLSAPDYFTLNQADRVTVTHQNETTADVVRSLGSEQLGGLSQDQISLVLEPGRYLVETEIQGERVLQSIEVRLDFDSLGEIEFDEHGDLDLDVPIAVVHLDKFSSARVIDRDGVTVDSILCNVLPIGSKLRVNLVRNEPPKTTCFLELEFRGGYPSSRVELGVQGFPTPNAALVIEPREPRLGALVTARIRRAGYRITAISFNPDHAGNIKEIQGAEAKIRFLQPGKLDLGVETQDDSGLFHHQSASVSIGPEFILDPQLKNEVEPGSTVSVLGRLETPKDWAKLSVRIADAEVESSIVQGSIKLSYRTPEVAPQSIPFVVDAEHQSGGPRSILGFGKINVGLGEKLILDESRLSTSDGRGFLSLRRESGFPQSRVSAIAAGFREWVPEFRLDEGATRLRVDFTIPPGQLHQPIVTIPYGGLRLVNLQRVEVEVSQRGRKISDAFAPDLEVDFKTPDFLRSDKESSSPEIAFYRVRPFLEWAPLTRVSSRLLRAGRVLAGEYRIALVHYGQIVWFKDFEVPTPAVEKPVVTPPKETYLKPLPPENFLRFVDDFMNRNSGTPPPVIGVDKAGDRWVFSGASLATDIRKFLAKSSDFGLIFLVLPGNHLTGEVARALFDFDGKWVALSYPALRNSQPTAETDFVRANLEAPITVSGRTHELRSIRDEDCAGWTPTMRIPCPHCQKALFADLADGAWRTYCTCGFESANVSYSLEDLKSAKNTVFVLQFQMFKWLARNWSRWLGARLGASLRCETCGYQAPFRNMEQFEMISRRMRSLVPGLVPHDLEIFVEKRLWRIRKGTFEPTDESRAIAERRCPKCCGEHLSNLDCGHPRLTDEQRRRAILLVGLEELAFPEYDPYSYQEDRFPPSEFPGLTGYSEPTDKLALMLETADRWWEEER